MALAASLALTACGGPEPRDPSNPPAADADAGAQTQPPSPTSIQDRLQGTWEIVSYTSERPIPDDAMSLMGELFDSLRLRFEGDAVSARAGRQAEERARFTIAEERGDAFRLVAKGGLFDGAKCRFVDADTWEATDHGPTWPGVSVLKRARR